MSADNVTPIRSGSADQPPRPPGKPRGPRQKPALAFSDPDAVDGGPSTLAIWQGLRGVCRALADIEGRRNDDCVERFSTLGAAADVLAQLMEQRLMI